MAVVIVGTLDTKGIEIAYARDLFRAQGLEVIVVDAGVLGKPRIEADIKREVVFESAGTTLAQVQAQGDRGAAVQRGAEGVAVLLRRLEREGRVDGVFGLGGSAGTVIGTSAMRALPFGLPKVMVSTLASGQTRPYVGSSDIAMLNSVADLAGLNRLTRISIGQGVNALAGMVKGRARLLASAQSDRPVIGATMFGVTTPCVDRARQRLEACGFEVLVFHATGIGGQSMEGLIRDGQINAVLDLTTTELADEVGGGVLSAGPERLRAARVARIPQVISVGAVDMINFGPIDTVPEHRRGRKLHVHNASVTLMRTTPDENRAIARVMADALRLGGGPCEVLLPLGGVSALDAPGKPFHDPEADAALFDTLRAELKDVTGVTLRERPEHINDPAFADFATERLLALLKEQQEG